MAEKFIDADALEKEMQEMIEKRKTVGLNGVVGAIFEACITSVLELVKRQATIEAKPVIHAYWIKEGNERTCSDCGFFYYSNKNDFYYCPKCGAQMDKVVSKADELDSLEKPNSQSGAENE